MKQTRSALWIQASLFAICLGIAWTTLPVSADPLILGSSLDSRSATAEESSFGDLCADALLAASPGDDFALCPASEMRPLLIPAGKTTTEHLAESLRSNNDATDTVVTMQLTGAQVRAGLAHSVSRAPVPFDGFLQVAGLTVHFDAAKHGSERVGSVTITATGQSLSSDKNYKVAMPRYLAVGSLGYFADWSSAPAPVDTHVAVTDAIVRYAVSKQPVAYQAGGRISGS